MFAVNRANVLITGGTSGIGLALAQRFQARGATVLVTGRDPARLQSVSHANPGLRTFPSDMGDASEREALARHVERGMPDIDVVINNAGIQRRIGIAQDQAPWEQRQREIDILLAGPIHLNAMLAPLILRHGRPALVVNVTSGGAYIPQPFAPTYAACKAALHSHTVTLRHALRDTPVQVVELIPPAVATSLAGPGSTHGVAVDTFADAVFPRIVQGSETEIGFGATDAPSFLEPLSSYRALFDSAAPRFSVQGYAGV